MPSSKLNKILAAISAILIVVLIIFAIFRDTSKLVSVNQLNDILLNQDVKKITLVDDYIYIKTSDGLYKIAYKLTSPDMFSSYKIDISSSTNIVSYIVVFVLLVGFASIIFRYFQKHKDKNINLKENTLNQNDDVYEPIEVSKPDVTFEDVGGIEGVKEELLEIVDFLKQPKKYKNFGARLPKGILLVGPPGVGKTMIAKALANEAGVSFYYQSGASFVQIYVGMGAKRVHELFKVAKNNSPSIIFIDEIDAVGKKRDGNRNDEREATLNQLLTEMDGFESQSGVIVIAATNKIDVLDSALLRAGRFDRRIFVDLPTKEERVFILQKYLSKVPNDVDVKKLAEITTGFNGASLAAFVNEAALNAIKKHKAKVSIEDFLEVKDKVVFGKRKFVLNNNKQKEHQIVYQSGKVVVATYFDLPFEKLLLANDRLTPPIGDSVLLKSEIEARIKTLLAGIVLCHMRFKEHLSSVKNDLDDVKELLDDMVKKYGMGESLLPNEDEKSKILQNLYDETKQLLETIGEDVILKVEDILRQKESISKEEVKKLLIT